jgi:hypothetical protein
MQTEGYQRTFTILNSSQSGPLNLSGNSHSHFRHKVFYFQQE